MPAENTAPRISERLSTSREAAMPAREVPNRPMRERSTKPSRAKASSPGAEHGYGCGAHVVGLDVGVAVAGQGNRDRRDPALREHGREVQRVEGVASMTGGSAAPGERAV